MIAAVTTGIQTMLTSDTEPQVGAGVFKWNRGAVGLGSFQYCLETRREYPAKGAPTGLLAPDGNQHPRTHTL